MSKWGSGVVGLLAAVVLALPVHAESSNDRGYAREIALTLEPEGSAGAPAASAYPQTPNAAQVQPEGRPLTRPGTQVAQAAGRKPKATSGSALPSQARLGIVLKDGTRILRRADTKSPTLYQCQKGTALGLVGQTKRYYAVLMVDRTYGFVDKSRVELYSTAVSVSPEQAAASSRIVQLALEYLGIPYVWGGVSRNGLDCSGFVQSVFRRLGVSLPRTAREQIGVGRAVRWGELTPGDRLYFSTHGTYIDHTGIYIGGGKFIHASGSAHAVVVSSVTERKYYHTLVAARRI